MPRTLTMLLAGLALALAACSTQAAPPAAETASAAVHPVSGLDIIPLTITQNGKTHRFNVEVARTSAEQSQGLMFRTAMAPDEGMIFPTATPQFRSFWMRNTVMSLDLLFIGADGLVSNIAANATPYSEESIPSDGPVIAVLDQSGGVTLDLNSSAIVYGLLFLHSDTQAAQVTGNGNIKIFGALVVEGEVEISGDITVVYDDTSVSGDTNKLPKSARFGRVSGSWLDAGTAF